MTMKTNNTPEALARQAMAVLDPDAADTADTAESKGQNKNGLAQLVLTLVKLLHELLEKQAIRRMDAGSLSDAEVERIGFTLMRQAEVIEQLREEFGLDVSDLELDLGGVNYFG
jgi:hypothetical protein